MAALKTNARVAQWLGRKPHSAALIIGASSHESARQVQPIASG
jgi:hypothetical protein